MSITKSRRLCRAADPRSEARDEDLYMIKGAPLFKNLENDPRYKAFLRKMNLPE
jgi:hypothetical protein